MIFYIPALIGDAFIFSISFCISVFISSAAVVLILGTSLKIRLKLYPLREVFSLNRKNKPLEVEKN